jgi:hypothetical protein
MKSEQWTTYRTRFLVKAKQLSSSFSFVDHLDRQHSGRKGDYLVESSDGVLSIAPRRIFEDIYVPMSLSTSLSPESSTTSSGRKQPAPDRLAFAPLKIEEVKLGKPPRPSQPRDYQFIVRQNNVGPDEPARVRRKLPQPCRVRPSSSGFGLM